MHSESPGTGHSDGCPNSGAPIETEGAKAVIDWLNGRAKGYTTRAGDVEVTANWTTGKVGMIGTSYNGTLPIAAATTGVEGLEAIVPISAISDWYDYYRANGMVRAPGGFQGEDLDVLTEYIYSRADETGRDRTICWPTIEQMAANQDRVTGNRSAFWQERNYMKDVGNVRGRDAARARQQRLQRHDQARRPVLRGAQGAGRPAPVLLPPGRPRRLAAGRAPQLLVHALPVGPAERRREHAEVVGRRARPAPARRASRRSPASTSNTATLTVANASPFRIGFTLTVPQTNANGTITNTTRLINNIAGNTLTLASAVATAAGQRVVDGATVSLVCGNANPTPYPEWPDPATGDAVLHLAPGGAARGGLTLGAGSGGPETLIDDAGVTASTLMNAASEDSRLLYVTNVLTEPVRISGTPRVSLNASFSAPKANLTAILVSLPASGNGTILTRGWIDPENRNSDWTTEPVTPGHVLPARLRPPAEGRRRPGRPPARPDGALERPRAHRPPGARHAGDARRRRQRPVAPGRGRRQGAGHGDRRRPRGGHGDRHGAGHAEPHGRRARRASARSRRASRATTSPRRRPTWSARRARRCSASPIRAAPRGSRTAPSRCAQPLQARARNAANTSTAYNNVGSPAVPLNLLSYPGPISNDAVSLEFRQAIAANDPLRTGTYSKTLTFTLSTTQP